MNIAATPRAAEVVVLLDVAVDASSEGARPSHTRRWSRTELLIWWRDRNYRYPVGLVRQDWHDDVDRLAVAHHFLSWNTLEQVASMVTAPSARAAMSDVWAVLPLHDRQLYRRRAAILLTVADEIQR